MAGLIVKLIIGWFLLLKIPNLVGASGILATIIKLVGILMIISGLVDIVYWIF